MEKEEMNKEELKEQAAAEDTNNVNENENVEEQQELDPVEKLQAELDEAKKQLLYKVAEFDNYRKHAMKERAELILNGGAKTIEALLPIVDDMERAIEHQQKTDDIDAVREGMEMIFQKLSKTLEQMGVKKIDAVGKDFDTDYHEAVAMVPGMGEDKKNKVIDCLQAGYTMNDKVLRFAKVAVGS